MEEDFERIKAQELELLDPGVRRNPERLAALLSDDFEEIGKSGQVYNKSDIISALAAEKPKEISASNFRFKPLSSNAVLVTFKTSVAGVNAQRSSLWIKRAGHWLLLHHQGTRTE